MSTDKHELLIADIKNEINNLAAYVGEKIIDWETHHEFLKENYKEDELALVPRASVDKLHDWIDSLHQKSEQINLESK